MSEMESEILVMNVGVKERGCEKERGKDRGSLALILSQLFLPYQARPGFGEKHVPTMHCGSCPSAWNEPLTPSYQLRGRLPVPVALHLWIQGQLCVQSSCKHTQRHMYAPDSAISNQKLSPGHITAYLFELAVQT